MAIFQQLRFWSGGGSRPDLVALAGDVSADLCIAHACDAATESKALLEFGRDDVFSRRVDIPEFSALRYAATPSENCVTVGSACE
jgi:hypothetical protein